MIQVSLWRDITACYSDAVRHIIIAQIAYDFLTTVFEQFSICTYRHVDFGGCDRASRTPFVDANPVFAEQRAIRKRCQIEDYRDADKDAAARFLLCSMSIFGIGDVLPFVSFSFTITILAPWKRSAFCVLASSMSRAADYERTGSSDIPSNDFKKYHLRFKGKVQDENVKSYFFLLRWSTWR